MDVRTAIALAAYHIGGWERLVAWIKESPQNEYAFWNNIWPRLAPVRVEGSGPRGELELTVKITREEIVRKLDEYGLPAVVFGTDKPVLELEAQRVEGNGSDGKDSGGTEGNGAASAAGQNGGSGGANGA
jgi:hypothetical protein